MPRVDIADLSSNYYWTNTDSIAVRFSDYWDAALKSALPKPRSRSKKVTKFAQFAKKHYPLE